MEKRKQIIIDNDGGSDDFVAIMYAFLSKKFDVKGITLVAGNTALNNIKENVFKALEMSGVTNEEAKNIGVYLPENVNEDIVSDGAMGSNGLGDVEYEKAQGYEVGEESAEDILIRTVNESPGEVSIIAIGPLTNIASALERNSDFAKNVKELVIMGGDEGGGNITPYAEFNIYQDPEAAKKVFEAGFNKISMIGFNISKQITLCPEVENFLRQNGEQGQFLYDITRETANLDRWKNKVDGASMNDILTLLYLLDEDDIFKSKEAEVEVDTGDGDTRGQTVIKEPDKGAKCNVVTDADAAKIIREMLNTIFPEKTEEIEEALEGRQLRVMCRDYIIENLPEKAELVRETWNKEGMEVVMKKIVELMQEAKRRAAKIEAARKDGEGR